LIKIIASFLMNVRKTIQQQCPGVFDEKPVPLSILAIIVINLAGTLSGCPSNICFLSRGLEPWWLDSR